jgi:hypothetical protein
VRSVLKAAGRAVPAQGISRRIADARNYWSASWDEAWPSDSHWRSGLADDAWLEVGRDHLSICRRLAKGLDLPCSPGRVIGLHPGETPGLRIGAPAVIGATTVATWPT